MKRALLFTHLLLVISILSTPLQAKERVTFASLLSEMADRSSLTRWPVDTNFVTVQASSYSRDSKSRDTAQEDGKFRPDEGRDWGIGWFENQDFGVFIREEQNAGRKELVMMEDSGAGAIVRFWSTYGGTPDESGGIYRIYIDGVGEPVIAMYHKDLIGGDGLIGKPYSFNAPEEAENPTWRGRNMLLPIPYAKSCKVTYEPKEEGGWNGHYYAINYRKYDSSVDVESFTDSTIEENRALIDSSADILTGKATSISGAVNSKQGVLAAGESIEISLSGTQAITALRCKIDAKDIEQALRSTVLEITFDGEQTVWCPLGQFYGIAYRRLVNNTFYITTDLSGNMESRWVMPFSKKAVVKLHNYGEQQVDIEQFETLTSSYKWSKNSLYFHATWNETQQMDTDVKFDYNFINIKGRGIFVGDNLTIYNSYPDRSGTNWWGEGDEKIYVDGEEFPSHFGTGTEDYYSYAWCRPQWFSSISVSQPLGEGNKTPGLSSNNRYRLLDIIPFSSSFEFDMEIWHPYYAKMNYSPATFWYAEAGAEWNYRESVADVQKPVARSIEDVNPDIEKVKVFILAGQSNAVGYNHIREMGQQDSVSLMKRIEAISGDVSFWAGSNAQKEYQDHWRDLTIGASDIACDDEYRDGCFGPEIGMALELSEKMKGEKIAIIKFAKGGRGIARSQDYSGYIPSFEDYDDQNDNFYPSSEGKEAGVLYKELIKNIESALTEIEIDNKIYEVCGLFWLQGEHEAGINSKMAEDYDELLSLFRSSIRRDLGMEDLPFYIAEINSNEWTFREIGRGSQLRAISWDKDSHFVKSADLERGGVGGAAHFTPESTIEIGRRFIEAFLEKSR